MSKLANRSGLLALMVWRLTEPEKTNWDKSD